MDTIHEKLPQTQVLLLAVFPRSGKTARPRGGGCDQRADRQARRRQDDRYLDIGHVFLDGQGEIPHDVMGDGLHPTAKGYELLVRRDEPTLDEMMKAE